MTERTTMTTSFPNAVGTPVEFFRCFEDATISIAQRYPLTMKDVLEQVPHWLLKQLLERKP